MLVGRPARGVGRGAGRALLPQAPQLPRQPETTPRRRQLPTLPVPRRNYAHKFSRIPLDHSSMTFLGQRILTRH